MLSLIARIAVLFAKAFAYDTLNLVSCVYQKKTTNPPNHPDPYKKH